MFTYKQTNERIAPLTALSEVEQCKKFNSQKWKHVI